MKLHPTSSLLLALLALGTTGLAVDSASEPKTLMTTRGKSLLSEDFKELDAKAWPAAKGKWEIADGALRGAEVPADKHAGVTRHPLAFKDAVIQYDFKLDGAKGTSLSINDKQHVCRVSITPAGFTVQKDDRDHEGPDKAVIFQKVAMPLQAGEWHTLVVEILGKEMLATVDGQKSGYGENERVADPKANLGFTVAGEAISIRNLRIWEAQPNPEWTTNKSKLAAAPAK